MNKIRSTTIDDIVFKPYHKKIRPLHHLPFQTHWLEYRSIFYEIVKDLRSKILEETVESKSPSWSYTKTPKNIVHITSSFTFTKLECCRTFRKDTCILDEAILKSLLTDLHNGIERKQVAVWKNEKKELLTSKPYVFSIEVTNTDMVVVELGRYIVWDYCNDDCIYMDCTPKLLPAGDSTTKVKVEDIEHFVLEPFSSIRRDLTDHYMETIYNMEDKIYEETIKKKSLSWRYTDKHFIRFFICTPDKDEIDPEMYPWSVVTTASEDERYITITSSFSFRKTSIYKPYLLEDLLKYSLAELNNKSLELFMDKPDIFTSKPYVFSIEVDNALYPLSNDADTVEVEIGMYALVNWKQEKQ